MQDNASLFQYAVLYAELRVKCCRFFIASEKHINDSSDCMIF